MKNINRVLVTGVAGFIGFHVACIRQVEKFLVYQKQKMKFQGVLAAYLRQFLAGTPVDVVNV